ncbi:hypothetical protein AVEN_40710-1 [Araneus ventricosus]|uniref:Uncharacterized protein n=1 Tax=Araneus ventricosus TaxID=182803 RepID=A0A4Y2JDZ8_ARAVE|nr:hypothetical protein AVEN_40710-1 [Araneus ventricosus]
MLQICPFLWISVHKTMGSLKMKECLENDVMPLVSEAIDQEKNPTVACQDPACHHNPQPQHYSSTSRPRNTIEDTHHHNHP